MKYISKKDGNVIDKQVFDQLSSEAQNNFIAFQSTPTAHSVTETNSNNLSIGDSIAVVALSPLIFAAALFGE